MRSMILALMLVAGAFAPALAHQQKAAITKVLFNPRTEHIEVMHRFYLHDAEHAVRQIFGSDADIIADKQTQQRFAAYVAKRFTLLRDKKALTLNAVGFESDGKFFWVYQETPIPVNLEGLAVRHHALRDIWTEQTNMVNIETLDGDIKTLHFDGNDEILSVEFGHQH
ncbi:hypothetical protein HMF8227_02650 [Saliniradius amylolyticus]|uniref:Orphan protein n=1 Tax=Saliniradius amylolyticus TaxID=2183582 RepID=A0A2S2E6E7_9ALTE|nr:DUF6702 family protein [Saliniradius amylolyticus]AWL13102.1 hypothetical protein HMF8227_02650 [Saliniradius amylolyticus]